MRVYAPAGLDDLRTLEHDGRLPPDVGPVLAVTPWALAELDRDDPEDEVAEHAVLEAAASADRDAGDATVAVLVFELSGADPPAEQLQVRLEQDLPRRRLVAVHVLPGLDWYAGHELPDVIALLAAEVRGP